MVPHVQGPGTNGALCTNRQRAPFVQRPLFAWKGLQAVRRTPSVILFCMGGLLPVPTVPLSTDGPSEQRAHYVRKGFLSVLFARGAPVSAGAPLRVQGPSII